MANVNVSIRKTIPSSDYYTASGDTTVSFKATNIAVNTKKTLIKINRPYSPKTSGSTGSDTFSNTVVDTKRGEDQIVMKGILEDESSKTAWEKAWELRGMCSTGGPLTSLVIGNLTFSSATQQVFLEEVNWVLEPDGTGDITSSEGKGIARIGIQLNFYLGDER